MKVQTAILDILRDLAMKVTLNSSLSIAAVSNDRKLSGICKALNTFTFFGLELPVTVECFDSVVRCAKTQPDWIVSDFGVFTRHNEAWVLIRKKRDGNDMPAILVQATETGLKKKVWTYAKKYDLGGRIWQTAYYVAECAVRTEGNQGIKIRAMEAHPNKWTVPPGLVCGKTEQQINAALEKLRYNPEIVSFLALLSDVEIRKALHRVEESAGKLRVIQLELGSEHYFQQSITKLNAISVRGGTHLIGQAIYELPGGIIVVPVASDVARRNRLIFESAGHEMLCTHLSTLGEIQFYQDMPWLQGNVGFIDVSAGNAKNDGVIFGVDSPGMTIVDVNFDS